MNEGGKAMTRDDIIDALKKAQDALHMTTLPFPVDEVKTQRALEAVTKAIDSIGPEMQRFAALVAAAEREACAKVCESYIAQAIGREMASAIRARGQT